MAGKPAATEITSWPGFNRLSPSFSEVNEEKARRFAEDPELYKKWTDAWEQCKLGPPNKFELLSSCPPKDHVVQINQDVKGVVSIPVHEVVNSRYTQLYR